MSRDRLEGADPVIGEDGLPTDPAPFRSPRWFVVVIALAVVLCLVMGVAALALR